MPQDVRVLDMDAHRYAVEVREGDVTTHHQVTVPDSVLDDLVIPGVDRDNLVTEAVNYLLERERNTELPPEIDLAGLQRDDPSFLDELRARLGGRPIPPEI
ncbi:hypothetical protein KIPE111705_27160 [Kibdelosporangium persicum]|uniref:Uncharacterized protein n=1 Tax=Kibdelosporangium persicum TaxID=2698649 RepID=A0ABX2EWB2_9PSEU|nr:hypothetical protein [Kibdelosporangium persicum]NRN63277.1 hypothetical protein [Kibdelosporangium persicum]